MKITSITPEQQARFGEWSKKWIEIGLSTEPADFDAATEAALKAYKLCNLEKPMVVLRMSSPYAATLGGALAWGMLRDLPKARAQVGSQVGSQVESQVRAQVWAQVESQVWAQVGSQVRAQVESQVRAQVGSQVRAQVGSQVGSQVRAQVWAQVGAQVGSQVRAQVRAQVGSQVESQVWAQVGSQVRAQVGAQLKDSVNNYRGGQLWSSGYSAYVSFFRDVIGWEDPVLERFAIDETLTKTCGWVWWHENVLAISDRPSVINRDDAGRLHCETGPSIAYRDGWSLYHWHGVSIPSEWVEDKSQLTAKTALTWVNVEQRRAACEIIGWAKVLKELKAKVIDKDGDPQIGSLLEVDLPDAGKERFIHVLCGTGREFALPVPRECKTALEANMWSYGLDANKAFIPEVRT